VSAVLPGAANVPGPRSAAGEAERPIVEPPVPSAAERPIVEPRPPSAAERLEASRARLRTALMAIAHPPPKPSLLGDLKIGSFGRQILERLKALPAAALVIESIEQWWAEHPLRVAGELAEEASRRYMGPIARKNPVAVIIGGVVFGALLVAAKPWRWLLRPALFVGLVPQIASHALKRMPLDAWLQMLSTLTGKFAAAKAPQGPDPASGLPKQP
jgi:hypothetical protein